MGSGVILLIMIKNILNLIGVEAGGPKNSKLHAAPLSRGAKIRNTPWGSCLWLSR